MILYTCASCMLGGISIPYLAKQLLAQRSYNLQQSRWLSIIATLYCVACSIAGWILFPPVACLAFSFGAVCMAGLFICDMQARILPTELVALLLAFAIAFRLAAGTSYELVAIALPACGFAGLCILQNALCRRIGKPELIGMGDIRAFVPLAIFSGIDGVFFGITACALVMGAFALGKLVLKKANATDHIAMAPGLAIWLFVGTLTPFMSILL